MSKEILEDIPERERNKRLLLLLNKLIEEKDFKTICLLRTMVEHDTAAMQKSFELMTKFYIENI